MSHFYGIINGNRGEATRGGSKDSGYRATAASWQGSVRVYLHYNEATGKDEARVELQPWHGKGTSRVLYDGDVDGSGVESASASSEIVSLVGDLLAEVDYWVSSQGNGAAVADELRERARKLKVIE